MQYLKLPLNDFWASAGYRSLEYREYWGFAHFGVDCYSKSGNHELYGLGNGIVKSAGLDGLNGKTTGAGSGCGYVLIIVYYDVYNRKTKKSYDVTCTYMHMRDKPLVKKGDKVTPDTLLGYYGNTGACTTGAHLHIQFDTDTKYYQYCSGVSSKGHSILKRGTIDSTVNPTELLYIGKGQTLNYPNSKWYSRYDFESIAKLPE